jgi:hypothetical protein
MGDLKDFLEEESSWGFWWRLMGITFLASAIILALVVGYTVLAVMARQVLSPAWWEAWFAISYGSVALVIFVLLKKAGRMGYDTSLWNSLLVSLAWYLVGCIGVPFALVLAIWWKPLLWVLNRNQFIAIGRSLQRWWRT